METSYLQSISDNCRTLKLGGIKGSLDVMLESAVSKKWSHDRFLAELLNKEAEYRDKARRRALITKAHFPQLKYLEDLDRNGTVDLSDGGDRYIAGQATPKVTLGSNVSFRYRDWYLSLQMNGAFGHKIFNGTGLAYTNMSSFPDYNVLKGAPEKNIVDQNVSDYWLENGDYLNIEYLTVGYDVPIKKGVVKSLRLSLSVNNLATITGYSGLTPMINSYVVNSTMGIDDKRTYPVYRTYSMGLSIQF